MTLSINNTQHSGIEFHYAECHVFIGMLSVIMPNVVMLNVVVRKLIFN